MSKPIDCLIIGHNEMDFAKYEKSIREMGVHSGASRDLNLNYFRHDGAPYHLSAFYNALRQDDKTLEPLRINEAFSATISYLGSYLHRRGFTFDFVNSFRDEKEELAKKLQENNILTIAITTTYYVFVLPMLEVIEFIKKHNRTAKIIVGGPFISGQVRTQDETALLYMMENVIGADFYVNSSQGETTLVHLLGALKKDLPVDTINNIYYRNGERMVAAPVLQETNKIAENPIDWNLFRGQVGSYANVRTAISCPFSCAFCGFPQHAGAYQTSPPQILKKEFDLLEGLDSLKGLNIIDDTFNVPVKRFKGLLRMMIENKYTFKWISNFRCQFVDREMVELMKQSGCEGVFLGIESASDRILKNMNKAASAAKYLEGISLLKEYGIMTFGSFIIGFPGETDETVRESIDFIEESGIDYFRAHLWYCDPITPVWQQREKYRIEGECFEWSHATMDAQTACDWVDKLFMEIKNSTWIPQYNFDFDNLWHLLHRGFDSGQIREFLNIFNSGVKEQLTDPSRDELSPETIKRLKDFCHRVDGLEAGIFDTHIELTEDYGVDFNF